MAKKWLRAIDSAQRKIVLPRPKGSPDLIQAVFEIQGIWVRFRTSEEMYPYADMADWGIRMEGEKPLAMWERLLRRPARIGSLQISGDSLHVRFWTRPALELIFDLNQEEDALLWRECEIMVLSAGFHFRTQETGALLHSRKTQK